VTAYGCEGSPAWTESKGLGSKVSLKAEVPEQQSRPAAGGVLYKPKGSWVEDNRFWVSDIDAVWVFDLTSRRGPKVDLPGIKFANDVAVRGTQLFISDNAGDQLYRGEPADFLKQSREPKVTVVMSGNRSTPTASIRPGTARCSWWVSRRRRIRVTSIRPAAGARSKGAGPPRRPLSARRRLAADHGLEVGSLIRWSEKSGVETLAKGFKGPADFGIVPESDGLLVVMPDLVASELRLVKLAR